MKKQFALVAGLAALTLSFTASAATVDLFSTAQPSALTTYVDLTPSPGDTGFIIGGGVGGTTVGTADLTILGGNRDMFVSLLTNGGVPTREASIGVSGGVLDFSVDTSTTARGQIQWDGAEGTAAIDTTGLGGIDLTQGGTLTAFLLDVIFSDAGFNFEVTAYTDADTFTRISFSSQAHPPATTTTIPFAAFMNATLCNVPNPAAGVLLITCGNDGVADLRNLGALVVDLTRQGGRSSLDLTLSSITTVPEPGVLALMGAGLMGLFGVGRRSKKVT